MIKRLSEITEDTVCGGRAELWFREIRDPTSVLRAILGVDLAQVEHESVDEDWRLAKRHLNCMGGAIENAHDRWDEIADDSTALDDVRVSIRAFQFEAENAHRLAVCN